MHEPHDLLRTLALAIGVAAVMTVVFQRLRLPVVFGYLVAGLVLGPHVPVPLIADENAVRTLSELGVVLLMFSLGLEFSVRTLVRTGASAVIVAVLQGSLMIWLGFEATRLLGWSTIASVFAGAALAISSTTIVVKSFAEHPVPERTRARTFGVLIVQDLVAILLLAVLSPAASPSLPASSPALTIVRLAGLLIASFVVGMLVVPRLVRSVVRLGRAEVTLVVSVGFCFVAAVLVRAMGFSVALGAFLAGSLVSESGEGKAVERLVAPIRDVFVALFFVSVGMTIDPALVLRHWPEVLGGTLLVTCGTIGAVSLATFFTGAGIRTAIQTGMSLGQIGEFSFILAAMGEAGGVTPRSLFPVVVAISAITSLTTPGLIRLANPLADWIDQSLPRPLQTFAALYGTWLEQLRKRPETSADRQRLRRAARALLLDAGVIAGLGIATSIALVPLSARLAARTALPPAQSGAAIVAAAVLASLPFVVGIVRNSHSLGRALSVRAFPETGSGRLDLAAAPRRALVVAVQLTTLLLLVAPLVAITQPFLPVIVGPGVFVGGAVVLALVLWRSAADFHGHVRAAAEAIVGAIGRQGRSGRAPEAEHTLERAYELLPGLGQPVPLAIGAGSPLAGRRLAELGLRGKTGATVIAISRGADVVLVPDGHEELRVGDVLALAGTTEAIAAARRFAETGEG